MNTTKTTTTASMTVAVPSLNRPLIAGLVAAISITCREHSRQWEALRSLWLHKALTWEEFQWLEHLEIVLGHRSRESEFGITPIPGGPGWQEIVDRTNIAVVHAIQFEENRKAHGLQAAFDMSNA